MYLRLAFLPFLLSSVFFQDPGDVFKRHYTEATRAQELRNFPLAEKEYNVILAEAYSRLGKVYSAQGNYTASVGAFESAARIHPDDLQGFVELSIAYFRTSQYQKSADVLQHVISKNA